MAVPPIGDSSGRSAGAGPRRPPRSCTRGGPAAAIARLAPTLSPEPESETAPAARAHAAGEPAQRWPQAFDGVGDGAWDWDLRTGEVRYSPRWSAMLGEPEAAVAGGIGHWLGRVHGSDLAGCWAGLQRHLRGAAATFSLEHRLRTADGGWRWVHARGRAVERAADGSALRVLAVCADIDARQRSQRRERARQRRLQTAVEAAGAGVFSFDLRDHRCEWDAQMHRLHDLAPGGYDGTLAGWAARIHPDDTAAVLERLGRGLRRHGRIELEFRLRIEPGRAPRRLRCAVRAVRDGAGDVAQIVGLGWDVSAEAARRQALAAQAQRWRAIVHAIGDGVVATDERARVLFLNPAAERMTGWSSGEAIGAPVAQVLALSDEAGAVAPHPVHACLRRQEGEPADGEAALLERGGRHRHIRHCVSPMRAADGAVEGAVLAFQDVTQARRLRQALEHSASHDGLTGLANRVAFERDLRRAIASADQEGRAHTLCFVDLDRFKLVNDGAGHSAGDALLREVAALLRRKSRAHDTVARIGGDEFALVLLDCAIGSGEHIARQICQEMERMRFVWDGKAYYVGASIGLVQLGPQPLAPAEAIDRADLACYAAKAGGRNRVSVYAPGDGGRAHDSAVRIAAGLRNAIEADRFCLFAQEIRRIGGAGGDGDDGRQLEILVRMIGEGGELIEPEVFIPAAQAYDLMGGIDRWVIRAALRGHGPRLREAGDVSIRLNLSVASLRDPALWPFLQQELAASGVACGRIHFEIGEAALAQDLASAARFAAVARRAGCRVSLDDFGKGVGSFACLGQFEVDSVKIDGGLVRRMAGSAVGQTIVESIGRICRSMGCAAIAEQVEDERSLELLRRAGIEYAQGYAVARPRPLLELL